MGHFGLFYSVCTLFFVLLHRVRKRPVQSSLCPFVHVNVALRVYRPLLPSRCRGRLFLGSGFLAFKKNITRYWFCWRLRRPSPFYFRLFLHFAGIIIFVVYSTHGRYFQSVLSVLQNTIQPFQRACLSCLRTFQTMCVCFCSYRKYSITFARILHSCTRTKKHSVVQINKTQYSHIACYQNSGRRRCNCIRID